MIEGRLTPSYYSIDIFNSINKHNIPIVHTLDKVGCFKTVPESRFREMLYEHIHHPSIHRYDMIGTVGKGNVPFGVRVGAKSLEWNSKVCNLVAVNNGKRFLCFSHGLRCRSECVTES